MGTRTMKVKVPTATLIELAEKERARIIREHEKASENADAQQAKWVDKALVQLDKVRRDIADGNLPDVSTPWRSTNTSTFTVTVRAKGPLDLESKPNTTKVDRDLALLRACSDETLSIGTDDNFAKYL